MHNILSNILNDKKKSLDELKIKLSLQDLKDKIKNNPCACKSFKNAITDRNKINIIAEIKKASPSAGIISKDFDPIYLAKEYTDAGASAISVLTEEKHFLGNIEYLQNVKLNTDIPVLRKDFLFDPYQIYESKAFGADAVLLIACILEKIELENLLDLAGSFDIECLVEVHDENDLDKVLGTPAEIIGINNRNLNDFSIDINTTLDLVSKIPKDKTIVTESGIKSKSDIEKLRNSGVNAFLVGETLMRSKNIKDTMKQLL